MDIFRFAVPQCAVCRREIARWETWEDYADRAWRVRVWCHGESEITVLSHFDLMDAIKIEPGVAFAQKKLACA